VRFVIASDQHQPRGVAVEAVDDPRPTGLATAEEIAENADERLAAMAGRWMHNQAGRLVDHRETVV
jgi:hypothetical protein